jgi:hypothetical protein
MTSIYTWRCERGHKYQNEGYAEPCPKCGSGKGELIKWPK